MPGTRIEQWFPLSAGSHYLENYFSSVWAAIGSQQPSPIVRAVRQLRGQRSRPELGPDAARRRLDDAFAPHRLLAARPGAAVDGEDRRLGTARPAAPTATRSRSTTRTRWPCRSTPSRTRCRTGSATRRARRPERRRPTRRSLASSSLGGPISVPASGDASIHFDVTVASIPGEYFNNAGAAAEGFTVAPTGETGLDHRRRCRTHTLSVTTAGAGTGNVTSAPAGIDCGTTCSATFDDGTPVVLTATPGVGSTFAGWSGDCSGTGSCSLTMDADQP